MYEGKLERFDVPYPRRLYFEMSMIQIWIQFIENKKIQQ